MTSAFPEVYAYWHRTFGEVRCWGYRESCPICAGTDWPFASWVSDVREYPVSDPLRPEDTDDEPWPLYPAPPRRNHRWLIAALAVLALIAWRRR